MAPNQCGPWSHVLVNAAELCIAFAMLFGEAAKGEIRHDLAIVKGAGVD
jgi:hypothetical protein